MSKEVYSIENQEKFNVAMIVGHILGLHSGTDYENIVENWTYDVELADFSLYIYESVKETKFSNDDVVQLIKNCMDKGFDVESLPYPYAENDENYCDFWYGVECGDFFGLPNKDSLKKADKAMRLFMEQIQYGFVHEVIQANNLE